jgi:small-conductance mechanosensitive channel
VITPSVIARLFISACLAGAFAAPVGAADAPPPAGAIAVRSGVAPRIDAVRTSGVNVVIFNRPIVRLRASVLGVSVDDRAQTAEQRIRSLLASPGEHKVSVKELPQGAAIEIDDKFAVAVLNEDVENLGEIAVATTAGDAARALQRVIAEMQEAHNPRAMLRAAGWSLIATVVWLALLWLLRRGVRAIGRRAIRFAEAKGERMRAEGHEIVQRERVVQIIRWSISGLLWLIALLITYKWLGYVLARFPFTRPWGEELDDFLVDTAVGMLTAVAGSVPGLAVAIIIFVLARVAAGMAKSFFDGVQSGRTKFTWIDADSARPTRRLASIAIWLFAVAMAYPYIPGAQTDAFKGLSVLLGLMVSVGASGIVGQAASGLILMYTRTFRPGEYVRVADSEGTVVALGLFTTRMRTGLGEELTLPNSMVLATVTKNYSRAVKGTAFILDTVVTIGYDAPWRQVSAMLVEAAVRTSGVVHDPLPRVFQTALSDFYVEYRLVCLALPTEPRPRAELLSSLHANVLDVFNEHGVQIMSPHYYTDPDDPKVVPPGKWYEPPAKPPQPPG